MNSELNDSESEEEILIFANFKDENIVMQSGQHVFKTIGMDTETPLIQYDNYIYKGDYQDCIGTNIFLEADPKPPDVDPIFGEMVEHPLKYVCKTRKNLNLDKIFLKPKCEIDPDNTSSNEDMSTTVLNEPQASSVQEAIDNFHLFMSQSNTQRNNRFNSGNSNVDQEINKRKTSFTDGYDS